MRELNMKADDKLDLRDIAAPYCFLICKSTLATMKPGAILEICLRDPEATEDLLTILDRSGEKILARERIEGCTRMWVEKGCGISTADCRNTCGRKGENTCPT